MTENTSGPETKPEVIVGMVMHVLAPTPNCPNCGAPPSKFVVRNHSLMWHDGDVYCECGQYIRPYDAG